MMRWKAIAGFDYYEISDSGKVRSIRHKVTCKNGFVKTVPEKYLRPALGRNGYLVVSLWQEGRQSMRYLHRLIAEAFIENPWHLPVINHKNGDKTDNHVTNLEWTTYSGNNRHAYRTGLKKKPVKLGPEEVALIRSSSETEIELSKRFGVCTATIRAVKNHRFAYAKEAQ
ncbi:MULTISPECIES: NUMOD4 domain-containing protein [Bifidobacterium]|nr:MULTISPECIES: NUMOD4 domain-containing protein [Bifidobacterium]TPF78384.1 hypothetical protein BW09_04845 [Bifidobacterium sp. UTCIF-1]TPF81196.1 hypothetical protein BW08_00735 [Bifidobacterium sp. UTCIF-24]TPF81976.1 hypothetical protein BW12_06900 [Bifidobacterium sp. UTCIF-3]TPF85176.1 hypothetical protein BW07_00450 [Bifidobacterium sp. UTCIF-36]TPF91463.1 hypothetical protein BW10_00465 [Bifidobacterium sp. UTBIF-56]